MLFLLLLVALLAPPPSSLPATNAQPSPSNVPQIRDPGLVVERYVSGIPGSPTTMAFLGDDTIIVLQKHDGQVRLVRVDAEEPYYAIGVRNSFGLAFDLYTGVVWDTENGDDDFDEINMVERNFNSGWYAVMGPATEDKLVRLSGYGNYTYSDPEFSWEQPVAPTALSFVKSEALARFGGSLFVGACNTGELYKFTMNERRDGFAFASPHLSDNVASRGEPTDELVFGTGFGCITDIEVGPDGLLYVLSLSKGTILRIAPPGAAEKEALQEEQDFIFYPVAATVAAAADIGVYLARRKRGPASV